MKRDKLLCSVESLKYESSWRELACAAFVVLVTAVFAFFFASDSSDSIDVTWAGSIVSAVWHMGGECVCNCLGKNSRLFLRVLGCGFAGFSAGVIFVFIRFMLLGRLRVLRVLDYYRMQYRLFYWTLCIVLALSFSRSFVDLFIPVSFQTILVIVTCLVISLGILYLRLSSSIFLILAYVLSGVFSAVSLAGVVVMLLMTGFYVVEVYFEKKGSLNGRSCNLSLSSDAFYSERLRLMLVFGYSLGFIITLGVFFSIGAALGLNLKDSICDWLKCYVAEFESTATWVMLVLLCAVTIAGIFILNRFNLMLTVEYYLKTCDVIRLMAGVFGGCLVLFGIGWQLNSLKIVLQVGNVLVPLAIQCVAAMEILMAVVIFMNCLRCRKGNDMNEEFDEGLVIHHRSKWLTFFLLLIFDIVPVALPVISTSYTWRGLF